MGVRCFQSLSIARIISNPCNVSVYLFYYYFLTFNTYIKNTAENKELTLNRIWEVTNNTNPLYHFKNHLFTLCNNFQMRNFVSYLNSSLLLSHIFLTIKSRDYYYKL